MDLLELLRDLLVGEQQSTGKDEGLETPDGSVADDGERELRRDHDTTVEDIKVVSAVVTDIRLAIVSDSLVVFGLIRRKELANDDLLIDLQQSVRVGSRETKICLTLSRSLRGSPKKLNTPGLNGE